MSCNSCAKPFTLFRQEKGCPSCGFSYCSKCLSNKVFVQKLNAESKVCKKCTKTTATNETMKIEPPELYYKRLQMTNLNNVDKKSNSATKSQDQQIQERLQKLKENISNTQKMSVEEEISKRLKSIKGDTPSTSDAELQSRLAKLRGVPVSTLQDKPVLPAPELRTEQEQAEDLLKQYLEQTKLDGQYKDEFDALVNDMESRVQKLKGNASFSEQNLDKSKKETSESEDEEETIKKIVEKIKAESSLEENEICPPPRIDELPFCEICNEDARMRCLGCRYLFCKQCFLEHKDDDDECNKYELYQPPKSQK